jgi:phospholipase C
MAVRSRDNALDHVVVVVSGNRSLDNVLGRLYGLRPATLEPRPGPGVRQL